MVTNQTLVWQEGMPDWVPIEKLESLRHIEVQPPPVPAHIRKENILRQGEKRRATRQLDALKTLLGIGLLLFLLSGAGALVWGILYSVFNPDYRSSIEKIKLGDSTFGQWLETTGGDVSWRTNGATISVDIEKQSSKSSVIFTVNKDTKYITLTEVIVSGEKCWGKNQFLALVCLQMISGLP